MVMSFFYETLRHTWVRLVFDISKELNHEYSLGALEGFLRASELCLKLQGNTKYKSLL